MISSFPEYFIKVSEGVFNYLFGNIAYICDDWADGERYIALRGNFSKFAGFHAINGEWYINPRFFKPSQK